MSNFLRVFICFPICIALMSCQNFDVKNLANKSSNYIKGKVESLPAPKIKAINLPTFTKKQDTREPIGLSVIIDEAAAPNDLGDSFETVLKSAIEGDPSIRAAKFDLQSRQSGLLAMKSQKDFQLTGTVMSGIESVSDRTAGVALILNARRMLYDGGNLDAVIAAEAFGAEAAKYDLASKTNRRLAELSNLWIDLERYEALNRVIEDRLEVLGPLIGQLEKVAASGIGDVSQVASAQRTVSTIRVAQTSVAEQLEQARVSFVNAFGALPGQIRFESSFIEKLVPEEIIKEQIEVAPPILSAYYAYQAAEANLTAVGAKDDFNIGFEARSTSPFGGSDYESDESFGLVFSKTLYNGKKLKPEIDAAEADVKGRIANLKLVYRDGAREIRQAQQTRSSMESAIILAQDNAAAASDEVVYLRKQLIIGGSTLGSVLSAEARLYDAASQEINFMANALKADVIIVSSLGLLARALKL